MDATENQIRPQPGPQTQALASPADILVYGGSAGGGKTWALLLEPLRHTSNPDFGAVIFRRTYAEITKEHGLWHESFRLYPLLGATPNQSELRWTFPSGARVSFGHLQHDKDVFDWHSSQIALIEFDELTTFTAWQFWYMLSRNRSMCGVRPYVRAGCNPDADSWVAELLSWWIDQDTGLALPDRSGRLRWFMRRGDQIEWADTPQALVAAYPKARPLSLSFIPASLDDNKILEARDPDYRAKLEALPLVERERLLGGNWKVRPTAGKVFNRAWFRLVPAGPAEVVARVRYWDKAGTEDGGDWSAGVRMAGTADGLYWVENVVRGQWSPFQRNCVMEQVAKADGPGVEIWAEQEPGSGGKESAQITVRELAGYTIRVEKVTDHKVTRAGPLSAQAEAGNVRVVAGDWNEAYLAEMHGFPTGKFDDQVDGSSGAFNKLVLARPRELKIWT